MPIPLAAVSMGIGAAQELGSMIKGGKARDQAPPMEDPSQRARLEQARMLLEQIRAGNDPTTQAGLREANQLGSQTQENLVRISAGNPAFALSAIRQAGRGTMGNINQVLGNITPMTMQQQGLTDHIASDIENRRLQLQLLGQARTSAQGAQLGKAGFANLFGGLTMQNGAAPGGLDGASLGSMLQKMFQGGASPATPAGTPTIDPASLMDPNAPSDYYQ